MDDDLRKLERAATAGDPKARVAVALAWERLGLGWWGDPLAEGVTRAETPCAYRFAGGFEASCEPLPDGRIVPTLSAISGYTDGKPPAPFEIGEADALLAAGYRWILVDMSPAPTTSDRSLGGLMRYAMQVKNDGGRMVFYGGNVHVKGTVDLLGLREVVDWCLDRDEALTRLVELAPD